MLKFNNKNFKTLRTLVNAKRRTGDNLMEQIDEISSSKGPENKKKEIISRMKIEVKKLRKDINKHEDEIKQNQINKRQNKYKEKQFTKQTDGLNFLLLNNDKKIDNTRKTQNERLNERFKDLNEREIREKITIIRKRKHYKALRNSFKEIYFYKNVNNTEIMKHDINRKLMKEFMESRNNKKSMSVHFDMKFVMITPEGDEKVRYHKNLLQDIPVLNVIPRIITEFYEGLGETILISTIQSNLIFGHIKKITIRIVNQDRKTGGDYIELSDCVRKSNSTINIKIFDNR